MSLIIILLAEVVAVLKSALEACLEANARLVTTQLEPHLVLDQLVTRILSRPA